MNFVTIQKHAELTGYTLAALRQKIQRGDFIEGVHYIKSPDGRVHINVGAYEKWLQGERLELKRGATVSG